MMTLRVHDKGIGIPSNEYSRVFSKYYRASTSTGIAGTGIGLSPVKHFVERHGGTIDVQSKVGMGSTFTLRLPNGHKDQMAQISSTQLNKHREGLPALSPQQSDCLAF